MQTTATVDLSDLLLAVDWISAEGSPESAAYVSRETGAIYWFSEDLEPAEDLPDNLDDEGLFAVVPRKNDLDLGVRLVYRFVDRSRPEARDTVSGLFRGRGAFGRFKDFLAREGLLQAWYDFEDQEVKAALREWAEGEGLQLKA